MKEDKSNTYCNHTCINWQCPKHPVNVPIDGTEVRIRDLKDTEDCHGCKV